MSSKRRRRRQCQRKRRFPDVGAAFGARRALRRAGLDGRKTLRPYRCRYCGQWHLGNCYRRARV